MARSAALLALVATVATHAAVARAVNVGDSSYARGLRGLQSSIRSAATASSSSSFSSSWSCSTSLAGDVFEVLPYAGDCPSVRTLVGNCNASIPNADYDEYCDVTCVVGPESSSAGSCDSPYSPVEWFNSGTADASLKDIEVFSSVTDWMSTVCVRRRVERAPATPSQLTRTPCWSPSQ
jgi:hypothetical protein